MKSFKAALIVSFIIIGVAILIAGSIYLINYLITQTAFGGIVYIVLVLVIATPIATFLGINQPKRK